VTDLEEAQAMGELQPRMRAGDKDRQRIVEQLGTHFGEGRLTVDEFDERVVRAHASVYLDELPALTADLPGEPQPQSQPRRRSRPQIRVPVLVLLIAMLLSWSIVAAVVYGAPPLIALFLLFMFLRHRRWSRRW
jgi:Flp pilus assembly protein TadB